jgi:hypothetical protein
MPDPSLWRPYVPTPAPSIFFLYVPHPGTHREAGICPRWMDVERKDTLLLFITILRDGQDTKALERFQFLPSRTINSLLTDYSQNYSCFRHTPLLLVKINNITHLD